MPSSRRHHRRGSNSQGSEDETTSSQYMGRVMRALVGLANGPRFPTADRTDRPCNRGCSGYRTDGTERRHDELAVPVGAIFLGAAHNHTDGMPYDEQKLESDRKKYGEAYSAFLRAGDKERKKAVEREKNDMERMKYCNRIPDPRAQATLLDSLQVNVPEPYPNVTPARRQYPHDIHHWLQTLPQYEVPPDSVALHGNLAWGWPNVHPIPQHQASNRDKHGRHKSAKESRESGHDRSKCHDKAKSKSSKATHGVKTRHRFDPQYGVPKENRHHLHHSVHVHHHRRPRRSSREAFLGCVAGWNRY